MTLSAPPGTSSYLQERSQYDEVVPFSARNEGTTTASTSPVQKAVHGFTELSLRGHTLCTRVPAFHIQYKK